MDYNASQPLTSGFARTARRIACCVSLAVIVIFALTSYELLHHQRARTLSREAHECAGALSPAILMDPTACTYRRPAACNRLVGIATLDAAGEIQEVCLEDPVYYSAFEAAVASPRNPVTTMITLEGKSSLIGGMVVAVSGDDTSDARPIVLLLRVDSFLNTWCMANVLVAVCTITANQLGAYSLRRWFDRRVAHPLRKLVEATDRHHRPGAPLLDAAAAGFSELGGLAQHLREIAHELAAAKAKATRVERTAQWQFRAREGGLNRQLRRAKDQATIDPLTKLHNRAGLDRELERVFAAQRTRDEDLAVVMIDVDQFKHLNDTQGHKAGDEVLAFLGELLRGTLRPGDQAIRYGGDEFLLLLPDVSGSQAISIVERVIKQFGQYTSSISSTDPPTLSAGIASLKADQPATGHELVTKADEALYRAKRTGRNAVAAAPA